MSFLGVKLNTFQPVAIQKVVAAVPVPVPVIATPGFVAGNVVNPLQRDTASIGIGTGYVPGQEFMSPDTARLAGSVAEQMKGVSDTLKWAKGLEEQAKMKATLTKMLEEIAAAKGGQSDAQQAQQQTNMMRDLIVELLKNQGAKPEQIEAAKKASPEKLQEIAAEVLGLNKGGSAQNNQGGSNNVAESKSKGKKGGGIGGVIKKGLKIGKLLKGIF